MDMPTHGDREGKHQTSKKTLGNHSETQQNTRKHYESLRNPRKHQEIQRENAARILGHGCGLERWRHNELLCTNVRERSKVKNQL